jgi:hypothetical protein
MVPEPFRDTVLVLDEFLDGPAAEGVFRMCSGFSYGGGPPVRSLLDPSIRLYLFKPCLDLALAHLPDGRDHGELLGPWARRSGFPVVDGLGGV